MKEAVQEFFRPMLASLCKVGLVFIDLWPINILIVSISHSWNQGDGMLILALIFMVGVDIVTKACSIVCRKIADDQCVAPEKIGVFAIARGFWRAISSDCLNSRDLFSGVGRKIFLYGSLVLFALVISDNRPRMIAGVNVIQLLADSIYDVLIVVELLSVLENFKESGYSEIETIKNSICSISEKAGWGKISAIIKIGDEKKEDEKK